MSGHVFHPGHEALHGITVVVEGTAAAGKHYVGRYHEMGEGGLLMHDVAVFEALSAALPWDAFLARTLKFGIKADHKHVVIPEVAIGRIVPLLEYTPSP